MQTDDLYSILEIKKTASADEIKKAYRSLARKHHPDKNQGKKEEEEKFKKIAAAYAVLGNEKKKRLYDQYGMDGLRDGFDPEMWKRYGASTRGGGGTREQVDFGGFSGFGSMEDIFESLFGGGGRAARSHVSWDRGSQQGAQIRSILEVDLLDAIKGSELEIAIDIEGRTRKLKVRLPEGVEDGQTIRLGGQGGSGSGAGKSGDLLIEIREKPDSVYTRQGADLEKRIQVTLGSAYKGGEVEVETPWGKGTIRIPPRTQGGARMRIKGQGIKKNGVKGNLYVRLDILVPTATDSVTKEAVEAVERTYRHEKRGKET